MSGPTPGPFHYRSDRTITDISGTPIARCYADRNEDGNGPLFAAAPDLLAALTATLKWIADECRPDAEWAAEGHNWNMSDEDRASGQAIITSARAALARATVQS